MKDHKGMDMIFKTYILVLCVVSIFGVNTLQACSRFTYVGPAQTVITGRSMDWDEDLHSDLWAYPPGIKRTGDSASPNSLNWISKYGSIVAVAYNLGSADGMNSEGLDANLLYLSDADYGQPMPDKKELSVFNWAQYVLDNYATVAEAVKGLSDPPFHMTTQILPNGAKPTLHLAITDPSGDNAVFEYVKGKLIIHHGHQYKVMTNEPTYDQQLALNDYWHRLNGSFLPGTTEPADRFIRASYYLSVAPQTSDERQAIATVFSIIRNVSAPFSVSSNSRPNVAPTLWRSVADLKHRIYYFENTNRPNVFWVDFNKLNLKNGHTMKLPLAHQEEYAGEVSSKFIAEKM